jgi:trk system potassium uptake protein TrkH
LLGGLGIPVLLDLVSRPFHARPLHTHTHAAVVTTALIYLVGVLLIFSLDYSMEIDRKAAIIGAATEVMNARTFGLPLGVFDAISRPSQWIVLLIMLIGASPAGTGGGLKTTTLYILVRDPFRLLRALPVTPAIAFAVLWLIIYSLVGFLTTLLLIWTYPQIQADRLLFLAASALSNCGTSQGPITLSQEGLFILSFAMLFGRFAPLALLCWIAKAEPGRVDVGPG